jgi:dUTP pyrophosphatase
MQYIHKGDRVAQLIILPYVADSIIQVDELSDTERSDGGFGHTGV